MSQAVSSPEQPGADDAGTSKAGTALGLAGLAIAFAFYLRLFLRVHDRPDVFAFFFNVMLPAATIHTALFLLLAFGFKLRARGIVIFWSLSAAALLLLGGWSSAAALILILLFGFTVTRIGLAFARFLLLPSSIGWGISLSLGIVFLSVSGAFLAWVHLFRWWMLALMILLALTPDLRTRMSGMRADVRNGWDAFVSGWSFPIAFALQAMFLLGVFAYVAAMAPETNSDAVRFYWPYMKLIRHYSGFFDGQYQWCYIIPQAGLIYGSAVLGLLGDSAVRLSMLLAWAALMGTVCRRWSDQPSGMQYAVALVVASCPVVLWVASSLMLDTFVCVSVVVLAVLCVEGREPDSIKFWVAVGICVGSAWAAKFSTLAYAVPLVSYAAVRSFKVAGLAKTLGGLALSGCCFVVTLSPWLYHSYEQCRNPVFPFLPKIFPSLLWPRGGLGFFKLNSFRLPAGWRGWILWPIDMTYNTSKFVEGFDGRLGVVVLMLLMLAIAVLWKGDSSGRVLAVTAIIATALLWSQTAYVRYWLPSLWLIAIAANYSVQKPARTTSMPATLASAAFIVMMPQVLFSMINYWPDPQGWPWHVYADQISPQSYLGGQFEGLSAKIERYKILGQRWPKIWFTGCEAVGHLQVQPMEATVWELSFHTLGPRSQIQYLCEAGCSYWIVNEEDQDANWFRAEGISHFFWNESNLILRFGALAVYRMPVLEQTLHDFDARVAPGTELLLNGGFEVPTLGMAKFWLADGDAPQVEATAQALEGKQCIRLRRNSGLQQGIALPPGLRNVELRISARAIQNGEQVSFRHQIYSLGFETDPATLPLKDQTQPYSKLAGKMESITVGGEWQQFSTKIEIPNLARYLVVSIDKPGGGGEVRIDSVHVYAR